MFDGWKINELAIRSLRFFQNQIYLTSEPSNELEKRPQSFARCSRPLVKPYYES